MKPGELPPRWGWLCRGFKRYVRRYLRKHFHAVRISKSSHSLPNDGLPILIVLNHPSWWDPLICVALTELLKGYTHYAAIDAEMLKKYKAFSRLGFFGVEANSLRGAANFLRTGEAILSGDMRALWVTAQGEFADARSRPLNLKPGAGHLAARLDRGFVITLAIELTYWNERTPEALVQFGEPIALTADTQNGDVLSSLIERRLTETLDQLNCDAASRDPAKFEIYHWGKSGVGGLYDWFRKCLAWMTFRKFDASHGEAKS